MSIVFLWFPSWRVAEVVWMVSIVRQEAARKLHFAKRDPFHMFEAAFIELLVLLCLTVLALFVCDERMLVGTKVVEELLRVF